MAVHRWPVHCIAADTISGIARRGRPRRPRTPHLAAQLELDRDQVAAGSSAIARPAAVDPVKVMARTAGWPTSADSVTPPRSPHAAFFRTPAGSPASAPRSARWSADRGAFIEGLQITGFPYASAGAILRTGETMGKFPGRDREHEAHGHTNGDHERPGDRARDLLARGAYSLPGHELSFSATARSTSPRASDSGLPISAVAVAATSVLWPARRPAQRPRTRDRSNGEAAAHAGPAASAADTRGLDGGPIGCRYRRDDRPCRRVGHGRGRGRHPHRSTDAIALGDGPDRRAPRLRGGRRVNAGHGSRPPGLRRSVPDHRPPMHNHRWQARP